MDVSALENIGLSDRESSVYLACLEHGPASISTVSRLASQKRSTTHYVMEELLRRGLLVVSRKGKRSLFDAQRPQKLLSLFREQERSLQTLLPRLEAVRSGKKPLPSVEVHEGEARLRDLYREIFEHFTTDGVCFLGSIKDIQEHMPFVQTMYFERLSILDKYRVRELLWEEPAARRWVRTLRKRNLRHPCKFLQKAGNVHNDLAIFGSRVAMFSFRRRPTAIVIDDGDVAATLRAMFECAWDAGEPA